MFLKDYMFVKSFGEPSDDVEIRSKWRNKKYPNTIARKKFT
jgi:hypothetical protein